MLTEKSPDLADEMAQSENAVRRLPGDLRTSVAAQGAALIHMDARVALHLARVLDDALTVRSDCAELAGFLRASVKAEKLWRRVALAGAVAALVAGAVAAAVIVRG